jgi:hypothetical protein
MPIILATWEAQTRRIAVQSQPRQIVLETLSQKYPTHKKKKKKLAVVQTEHLPSKHEALNSTSPKK